MRLFGTNSLAINYNGFQFPPHADVEMAVTPEYDAAGRTVKYRRYNVSVSCILGSEDFSSIVSYGPRNASTAGIGVLNVLANIGSAVESLSCILSEPGKRISMSNCAAGVFDVKSSDDLLFGPKPKSVVVRELGNRQAIRISWQCEFVKACCEGMAQSKLGEFSYSAGFSVDTGGMLTRTMSGTAETAVYRVGGQKISATADALRSLINVPTVDGFTRATNFSTSPDKRVLSFTFTDTEIPSDNPYFPGILRCNCEHRVSNAKPNIFLMWNGSIGGTFEVAAGYPKSLGLSAFLWIVRDRILVPGRIGSKQTANQAVGSKGKLVNAPRMVSLDKLSISESIFSRSVTVGLDYTFTCPLDRVLKLNGLFSRPYTSVRDTTIDRNGRTVSTTGKLEWSHWTYSLRDLYDNYGYRKLEHVKDDDVIVDFCTSNFEFPEKKKPETKLAKDLDPDDVYNPTGDLSSGAGFLEWNNSVRLIRKTGVVTHVPLGAGDALTTTNLTAKGDIITDKPKDYSPGSGSSGGANPYLPMGPYRRPSSKTPGVINQNSGASYITIELAGYAERVGDPIQVPALVSVSGMPAVLLDEDVKASTVVRRTVDGKSVYAAAWVRYYSVAAVGDYFEFDNEIPLANS